MPDHHLAQLNIARLRAPIDSPELAGFVALLPEINGLAERSPGYVWRLQDDSGDATARRPFGPDIIINLTVWQTIESLRDFTYRTTHLEPMRRRREWFLPADGPHLVLWWIPAGTRPTTTEAADRLNLLRRGAPSPEAFTFRDPHPAPPHSPPNPPDPARPDNATPPDGPSASRRAHHDQSGPSVDGAPLRFLDGAGPGSDRMGGQDGPPPGWVRYRRRAAAG